MLDVDRIKILLDRKRESKRGFAKQLGITEQGLYDIFRNKSSKRQTVEKMASILDVSIESLYIGNDLIVAEPATAYGTSSQITYVPVQAQAGFFNGYTDIPLTLKTFTIPEMPEGKYYAFSVEGDSMAPTINSGDIVVCSKLNNKEEIKPNAVHVMFDKTEGVVVKRLIVEDTMITCISDNPKHKPYSIKSSTVKDVYRVRRVITSNI